ncbi:MAG: repeat protein [Actinomycetota bacterium]|nr:repeat protein [Actinomycetota bacterium]
MTASGLVTVIGQVMLGIYGLLLLLLVAGVLRTAHRARRARVTDEVSHEILAALADHETAPDDRAAAAALARIADTARTLRGTEVRLTLMAVATAVGGESLAALRDVADRLGLIAQAERSARHRSWVERLLAARFLTALSVTSGTVRLLLRDPHCAVRAQAAAWVTVNDSPETVGVLGTLLVDPDPRCRFAAKDTLARLGTRASAQVESLLRSPDPIVRRSALEIAGAAGDPVYLPALREIALTGEPAHQALAATALGATGDPEVTGVLRDLLGHPDATVRHHTVTALAATADWRHAADIVPLLHDRSHTVRRAAGMGLLRLGAPGLILLREAASRDSEESPVAQQILQYHDFASGRV